MSFWSALPETLLIVVALSIDAFVASFAYGASKIKIPPQSIFMIDLVCTLLLALGLLLSNLISNYLPEALTQGICVATLLLLGCVKLFDSVIKSFIKQHTNFDKRFHFSLFSFGFILNVYAKPEAADQDCSMELSLSEAAALAIALSIDGLAVGLGVGLTNLNTGEILIAAGLVTMLAVVLGSKLGNRLARYAQFNVSWLSGVLLIVLAFLKL